MKKRKINIYEDHAEYDLCVIIEGECNHADTDFESEEFDEINLHGPDRSFTVVFEVCEKCRAYKRDDDGDWHDVTVLPEPFITNSGELIQDVRK